jgi:hypothetical protein
MSPAHQETIAQDVDVKGHIVRGIQDHALIGNLRTAAVVSIDASIESMCIPYFDSPSVFARILDADKGGHFSLNPTWQYKPKQAYAPNSNVLGECRPGPACVKGDRSSQSPSSYPTMASPS